MKRRVIVTGMGGLSPIGNTVDEMWANAKNGFCGIEEIKDPRFADLPVYVAGEVKNFDPTEHMSKNASQTYITICTVGISWRRRSHRSKRT